MSWYRFIDGVVLRDESRIVATRTLRADEPFFRDHFPGHPILPGVLVTEAMLQAARLLLEGQIDRADRLVLASARALRFSRFVGPGQTLVSEVVVHSIAADGAEVRVAGFLADAPEVDPDALRDLPSVLGGRLALRPPRLRTESHANMTSERGPVATTEAV
ncbi:MAG: hypothetical protein AAFX79_05950 [Planctomycetota bacterium]